jgi:chemotaxis protein CheD
MTPVRVKMAEYIVSNSDSILKTTVGSCVAIGIYDGNGIGGLAHIMLPECNGRTDLVGKFADTAIPAMVREMEKMNADISRLRAKIAGGAQMFTLPSSLAIGERNIEKVKKILRKFGIKLIAEDTGKNHGRTVEFHTSSGRMVVKRSEKIIAEL